MSALAGLGWGRALAAASVCWCAGAGTCAAQLAVFKNCVCVSSGRCVNAGVVVAVDLVRCRPHLSPWQQRPGRGYSIIISSTQTWTSTALIDDHRPLTAVPLRAQHATTLCAFLPLLSI